MEVPDIGDIDPNFEPQTRARSNTWPLRPKVEVTVDQQSSPASDEANNESTPQKESLAALAAAKKTSSRRNAWGNLSYADLITKAIQSSPEQRLTLSQIYDWMVQNVPYFRDKGDSNSSAGWKNSIRHNLSLHNRFMRIQNEGTGKSSWWVINPDAKPGKPARRRTSSMETNKSLVCKRDRVRKRVRELKNQRLEGVNSHITDENNYNFSLSPSDPNGQFRERVDSAHSTHSGRLSPIPSVPGFEIDIDKDPEDDPPWEGKNFTSDRYTDTLVDDLIDGMKLVDNPNGLLPENVLLMATSDNLSPSPQMLSQYNRNNNYSPQYADLPAPPPYPEHHNHSPRQQSPSLLSDLQTNGYDDMAMDIPGPSQQQNVDMYQPQLLQDPSLSMSVNSQGQQTSPNRSLGYLPGSPYGQPPLLSPKPKQLSPQPLSPQMSPQMSPQLSPQPSQQTRGPQQALRAHSALQQQLQAPSNSLLLKALTRNQSPAIQAQQLHLLRSLTQARQQAKLQQYNAQLSAQMSSVNGPVTSTTMNSPMEQMPMLINNSANSRLISQLSQPPTCNNQILDQLNQSEGQGSSGGMGMSQYMGDMQMNNRVSGPLPTSTSSTSLGNLNDLELDALIGCDVDQVIDQELQFGGNLDFNFEQQPSYVDLDTLA